MSALTQKRDAFGRFVKSIPESVNKFEEKHPRAISVKEEKPDLRKKEQPLIDVKITNPVSYLKSWWKRVMGQEGIDLRFRIHPITAIAMSVVVAAVGFGIGRITIPGTDWVFYDSNSKAIPNPASEDILTGLLKISGTGKYYLITSDGTAVQLVFATEVNIDNYEGKRILATGKYDSVNKILNISNPQSLELLSRKPMSIITPTPTSAITSTPIPTDTPVPTFEPQNISTPSSNL